MNVVYAIVLLGIGAVIGFLVAAGLIAGGDDR